MFVEYASRRMIEMKKVVIILTVLPLRIVFRLGRFEMLFYKIEKNRKKQVIKSINSLYIKKYECGRLGELELLVDGNVACWQNCI